MTKAQKISFFKIKRLSVYIFFCALYNVFYFFSYENVGTLHCEFLCISGMLLYLFSWVYMVLAFIFMVLRIHFLFSSKKILIYFLLAIISLGSSFFLLENKILFLGLLSLFFVFYFLFSLTLASLFKEVKISFYFAFLFVPLGVLFFIFFEKLGVLFFFLTLHFLTFVYAFERYKFLKKLINDFKNIKKLAWVVFVSFLLCVCFQFLPIFAYDLKLLNYDLITDFLARTLFVIFLISYLAMILKLYFASESKVLLISFFIAIFTQFIALLSLNYLANPYLTDKILRIFLYGFSFLCPVITIFCNFIFFKTLKTLCENKSYFMACFLFKSAIFIIIYIFMFVLIYSEPSFALTLWFMIYLLFAIYYALFAFSLSKNQNIKLSSNLKLVSNEKENI